VSESGSGQANCGSIFPARRRTATIRDLGLIKWRPLAQVFVGVAIYALFLLTTQFEHHDLLCHLKTPQHCTSCTSSQLGSFFYLIIGAHAVHAVVALAILCGCWGALRNGTLTRSRFGGAQLFWYFVVLVWPLLYWQVYL
jgi:cytochrome c oxidase subunit 3